MGRGHLSIGTMILTVEPGRGEGVGVIYLGTMILGVERGGGGGGGGHLSLDYNSIPSEQGEGEGRGHGGHLSLGKMIFKCRTGRRGGGGVSFVSF